MGGGGGGRYFGPLTPNIRQKIDQAKERELQNLYSNIDSLLNDLLTNFNQRNTEDTQNKLEELKTSLSEKTEIDQLLFGGSVAKHTEIDGLSDVDALVILDRSEISSKSPEELLTVFHKTLEDNLPRNKIENITKGQMAVSVKYTDGNEIQLLPALKSKNIISIATKEGKSWNDTKPRIFQKELTAANKKMNQCLVPSIKLFKSINYNFPKQKQLNGYHIETLAVESVKNYTGPKNPRNLLLHLLGHASERVLSPMRDKTGQTRTLDAYLGKEKSLERRNISQTLIAMRRRLASATTVSQWRTNFEE